MARDQLGLYNRVLILLEGEQVPDLSTTRREVKLLNAIWEDERDAFLEGYQWNFATRRLCNLETHNLAEDCDYPYALKLPDDFIRLTTPIDEDCNPRHSIEDVLVYDPADPTTTMNVTALVSDASTYSGTYIRRMELERFSPLAFKALAAQIAMTAALDYSGKSDRYSHAERHYMKDVAEARRIDATQGSKGTVEVAGSRRRQRRRDFRGYTWNA